MRIAALWICALNLALITSFVVFSGGRAIAASDVSAVSSSTVSSSTTPFRTSAISSAHSSTLTSPLSSTLPATLPRHRPHLDLELSGAELNAHLRHEPLFKPWISDSQDSNDPLHTIIRAGVRNLEWIQKLNEGRSKKLSFSAPNNQQGYPISQPSIYNAEIILGSFEHLKNGLPSSLKEVLIEEKPYLPVLPLPEEEYLQWGLALDRIYQLALRWKSYTPYIDELTEESHKDLRGYYAFKNSPALAERLRDWATIPDRERSMFVLWLNQICRNNYQNKIYCQWLVKEAIEKNEAFEFYQRNKLAGEMIWNDMMTIPKDGRSSFLTWKTPNIAEIPFIDPLNQILRSYFIENIQQEWKFPPNLSIHLFFVDPHRSGVKVIWEPGVTPYVPGLGAGLIYMDANAPISEYDVQWTIRHEFGHVLGFPDCYLEFYDEDASAIVGYQLDTSDLMCSRRGHLKSRHVSELKRAY